MFLFWHSRTQVRYSRKLDFGNESVLALNLQALLEFLDTSVVMANVLEHACLLLFYQYESCANKLGDYCSVGSGCHLVSPSAIEMLLEYGNSYKYLLSRGKVCGFEHFILGKKMRILQCLDAREPTLSHCNRLTHRSLRDHYFAASDLKYLQQS